MNKICWKNDNVAEMGKHFDYISTQFILMRLKREFAFTTDRIFGGIFECINGAR